MISTKIATKKLVDNGNTGLTFKYKDISDLQKSIKYMFERQDEAKRMGENAYNTLIEKYSPDVHYKSIIDLFNSIVKQ